MKTKLTTSALAMAIVAMSMGTVRAEGNFDAQAEFAALKQEVARLRSQNEESWLNERRAEEVKTLIHEVLSDADTRASLAEGGMTAGHNGKHFFLASEDGKFLMEIFGQIQIRYVYNTRDEAGSSSDPNGDDHEFGMQIRRTKIGFQGHIGDPKLHYVVKFQLDRDSEELLGDTITIAYDLTDSLTIWAGEDKAPFLREEFTSSARQLAVERSYVNETFTLDRVQGVGLIWDVMDNLRLQGVFHDGARSGEAGYSSSRFFPAELDDDDDEFDALGGKDFYKDDTDFAVTGRVDWVIAGTWDQFKDFTSFPGEEMFLQVGGAVNYWVGETGDDAFNDKSLSWTIDASFEYQGLNIFAAFVMAHNDLEDNSSVSRSDNDPWGVVAQIGYNIDIGNGDSLEPFFRYEHIDFDSGSSSSSDDELDMITFGVNWYHAKHTAKLTADVVWAFDPVPSSESGLGLLSDADDEDDQMAIRIQYQLLF